MALPSHSLKYKYTRYIHFQFRHKQRIYMYTVRHYILTSYPSRRLSEASERGLVPFRLGLPLGSVLVLVFTRRWSTADIPIVLCLSAGIYMYTWSVECRGFESHPRQLIFLRKSDCLGCAVWLCLVVCLILLASCFLPSLISH